MAKNKHQDYDWLDDPFNDKKTHESKLCKGNNTSSLWPLVALIVVIVLLVALLFPILSLGSSLGRL